MTPWRSCHVSHPMTSTSWPYMLLVESIQMEPETQVLVFILFHCIWCNLHPSLNLINADVVYKMDLQQSRESNHDNNLFCQDQRSTQVGSCRPQTIPQRNKQGPLFLQALSTHCPPSAQESSNWPFLRLQQDNDREVPYHPHWATWNLLWWDQCWVAWADVWLEIAQVCHWFCYVLCQTQAHCQQDPSRDVH